MKLELLQSIRKGWSTTRDLSSFRKGFLLVEVILASAMFVLFIAAFSGVLFYGQQSSTTGGNRARASILAEEGQEAVRSMKNVNFANITDGPHGLIFTNNAWSFSGTQDVDSSGLFTRVVTISPIDTNRKNVTSNVTWQETPQRAGAVTLDGRVSNWKTVLNLGQGLMVNSIVINHGLSNTTADFSPYKVGTTTVVLGTSTKFGAGTYTVTETLNSNFNTTFSNDCNASGQVTLTSSSSKLCTITNEEKLTYITASTTVINHGGNKIASDFAPYKVGSTTVTAGAATLINSGTYMITEATSSTYILTYTGGCFTSGQVVLNPGDNTTCMLTNEEMQAPSGPGGGNSLSGILIYGDGTNIPKYRTYIYSSNSFSAQTSTFTATVGPTWLLRTSPTQHQALAGYYDSTGTLTIMCFDGTNWYKEWTGVSGGVGNRHRFDITFEKTTGRAMVVFSKGGQSSDATRWGKLGYRIKSANTGCGVANWSTETILTPARTSSDIMYVRLAQDKRSSSNLLALTWVDTNDDISAAIWDGTNWVNEPASVTDNNLEIASLSHDVENMDIEYESLSGNLMLVWANANGNNGTNGVRYRRCTGGIAMCTWGAVTTPPTFLDDATNLDISANPLTNEMVFASIGKSGGDLQAGYWNGSAWTNTANVDTSCSVPYTGSKLVTTGWVTYASTTRSIIVYSDLNSGAINWYTGNAGVFTRQPDFTTAPVMATPRGYMDIYMDPVDRSQFMFLNSDNASDLYAKRLIMTSSTTLTWSNSDGAVLEPDLPQIISSPFSFAFWQK